MNGQKELNESLDSFQTTVYTANGNLPYYTKEARLAELEYHSHVMYSTSAMDCDVDNVDKEKIKLMTTIVKLPIDPQSGKHVAVTIGDWQGADWNIR